MCVQIYHRNICGWFLFLCFFSASSVLLQCFFSVSSVLLWWFFGASLVVLWWFFGASLVLLQCFFSASLLLLWCFFGASSVSMKFTQMQTFSWPYMFQKYLHSDFMCQKLFAFKHFPNLICLKSDWNFPDYFDATILIPPQVQPSAMVKDHAHYRNKQNFHPHPWVRWGWKSK